MQARLFDFPRFQVPLQSAGLSFQNAHLKLFASMTGQEKIRILTDLPAFSQEKKCEREGGAVTQGENEGGRG